MTNTHTKRHNNNGSEQFNRKCQRESVSIMKKQYREKKNLSGREDDQCNLTVTEQTELHRFLDEACLPLREGHLYQRIIQIKKI